MTMTCIEIQKNYKFKDDPSWEMGKVNQIIHKTSAQIFSHVILQPYIPFSLLFSIAGVTQKNDK